MAITRSRTQSVAARVKRGRVSGPAHATRAGKVSKAARPPQAAAARQARRQAAPRPLRLDPAFELAFQRHLRLADRVRVQPWVPPLALHGIRQRTLGPQHITDSGPARSFCGICYMQVPTDTMDTLDCCKARFCRPCLLQYFQNRVQDRAYPIKCPHYCPSKNVTLPTFKRYLSAQLPSSRHDAHQEYQARQCTQELQRHRETQAEKAIPAHRRFFCPNAACSRVLARRGTSSRVTCPTCRAVACCWCRGPFHGRRPCSVALQQEPGRSQLSRVAQQQQYTRCDVCGMAVERIEGCTQMTCTCGHVFDHTQQLGRI